MSKFALRLFAGGLLALGVSAAPAHAQLARTFVSAFGNDANNCDRPTPCRTFQRAHDNTLALGEITVLDPGGYGAVTITKGMSIINDGVGEAGVLVSGGAVGITITATAADHVSLRGLTVKGIGFGGSTGIVFNSGATLTVENCVLRNHSSHGIFLKPNSSSNFEISNTVVADNGGSGIFFEPSGLGLNPKAVFNRVEIYNNTQDGISLEGELSTGTINATATDSVSAGNGGQGFVVTTQPTRATTTLVVIRSLAANNVGGLNASCAVSSPCQASVLFSQSTVTGNATGVSTTVGANMISYGDNIIDTNSTPGTPTGTLTKK